MRIVVFGAAGRTGKLAVDKALGHGHDVVAVVHDSPLDVEHPRLTAVAGDVLELDSVRRAVSGADGVIFALSSRGGTPHIHERGVANVIYAMAENEVSRLAAMSAIGALDRSDPRLSLSLRVSAATVMRASYDDLEAMERRIMASGLSWTIVRAHRLIDAEPTGHYRTTLDGSPVEHGSRVPRGDVAALLVKAIETDTYYRRAVGIAS